MSRTEPKQLSPAAWIRDTALSGNPLCHSIHIGALARPKILCLQLTLLLSLRCLLTYWLIAAATFICSC